MASSVFFDSNGWVALLNRRDAYHAGATRAFARLERERRRIITTDWILAETGNSLSRTPARPAFVLAVRRLSTSSSVSIVRISEQQFTKAVELYARMSVKQWGLVDCASFVVMGDYSITEAFTSDHHFEQAGFRCLLESSPDGSR